MVTGRGARRVVETVAALCLLLSISAPAQGAGRAVPTPTAKQANADDELVYLDPSGVIRVFDPTVGAGEPQVVWRSPGGGWSHIALGDFNADGDIEIAAISSTGENRLAVYDPVAEGLPPGEIDGVINGIPWKLLHVRPLPGAPSLVAAGDFDLDSPADEIVYYYRLPPGDIVQPDDVFRFVFLVADGSPPNGQSWSTLITHDSGNAWNWAGAGNFDGAGIDEVALIASDIGTMHMYALAEGALRRIGRFSDSDKEWQDGATGQFRAGGQEELAAGRETISPLASLLVMHYLTGEAWADDFAQYFDPPPASVFMADISGNGDDEVVALRLVPPEHGNRPRLFVRDNGNDTINMGEPTLDADNGYRTGIGGDVDGDGRDEVVVMRNNRIRIFTEPERSSSITDEPATTDAQTLLAGNLDANGLSGASRFGASPSSISEQVTSGATSETRAVALSDVVNGRSIPFTYSLEDGSTWIDVTRSGSRTPATLSVTLSATGLISGTFSDRLIIDTNDSSVVNAPYAVDVSMTVNPGISLTPSEIAVVHEDCAGGQRSTVDMEVVGTPGAAYTLTFQAPVAWASVSPITGTVPSAATLTLDGGELGSGIATTEVVVRAVISGSQSFDRSQVALLCGSSFVRLPSIRQ